MQLLLAPMEGVLDFALRDTLTRVGAHRGLPSGIDRCVSEFIRITDTVLPARAFVRTIPELLNGGRTASGVPVRGQLLGSDPELLAANAVRLAELGSHGVDLNFGCPAQVVNRHGGGSSLLQDPELLHRIVGAVRRALPPQVPVSAKMRLGFHDDTLAEDCALAIAAGGAAEIVVHARTKVHGYRPPAYWERIADLRTVVQVPLVANGEIWSAEDALRCQQASGCTHLMLGRGMVADPGLALAVRAAVARQRKNLKEKVPLALSEKAQAAPVLVAIAAAPESPAQRPSACHVQGQVNTDWPVQVPWPELLGLMQGYWALVGQRVERRHRAGRLKQWLNLLRRRYPEAQAAFEGLRTTNDVSDVEAFLSASSSSIHVAQSGPNNSAGCCVRSEPLPQAMSVAGQ
ncbi:tRNA dihydrouridine(16) synthase DusC [Hydrogenophaga soli]